MIAFTVSSSKLAQCFDLRYAYLPYVVAVSHGYAQYTDYAHGSSKLTG
jgi:hypothetical protein